jgi:predicted metal-dependent HD superfamily phosphohydrolase
MSIGNIVIGLLVLAYIIGKQVTKQPLSAKTRLGLILAAVGLVETWNFIQHTHVADRDLALVAASIVIGLGLAVLRARTVRVWADQGNVWQQGSWVTAALWVVGIGQHLLVDSLVASALGADSLLLYFGVVIFAQRQVVLARARAHGLVPPVTASTRG